VAKQINGPSYLANANFRDVFMKNSTGKPHAMFFFYLLHIPCYKHLLCSYITGEAAAATPLTWHQRLKIALDSAQGL
jgi:hypothetical protein